MTVAEKKDKEQVSAPVQLLRDTRAEIKKVVWPTREEIIRLTILVIAVSAVIGVVLFGVDSFFLWLYTLLLDVVS
ncbi:MAG: preprotein translocase subunit SecE [Chloroflexaceae bacterium]|nr:preprotein translocase subunit SecE [Chloroflexaceae bacterium]